jgi:hypothetical protein
VTHHRAVVATQIVQGAPDQLAIARLGVGIVGMGPVVEAPLGVAGLFEQVG